MCQKNQTEPKMWKELLKIYPVQTDGYFSDIGFRRQLQQTKYN